MPEQFSADVVVIGAGAAGLTAAITAAEAGADVLLLCKGPLGKAANTAMAAGLFNAAGDTYPAAAYREETLTAGQGLNDPRLVELLIRQSTPVLEQLRQKGVPLEKTQRGFHIAPGARAGSLPGGAFTMALSRIVGAGKVRSLPGFQVFKLIIADGRIAGIHGLAKERAEVIISAPAVILASGGGGALYQRHDNAAGITGDGYAMALQAGCRLQDLEFVQFYPIGLCETSLPQTMVHPPYPAAAHIYDSSGRDALAELGNFEELNQAITQVRDQASLLFYQKYREGGLFLDLTEVPELEWKQNWALQMLERYRFDFHTEPCRIAPLVHFFMGGVTVDTKMQTDVPGLFAAGEVVGGLHGANRMGGNALTECVVEGVIAGGEAAGWARQTAGVRTLPPAIAPLTDTVLETRGKTRSEFHELFTQLKQTAWNFAGITRKEEGLHRGMKFVAELESGLDALAPDNLDELIKANQLKNGLLVLRCIFEASLTRKESRGAFFREDYPQKDDSHWRRNIYVRLDTDNRLALEQGALL